MPRARRSTAARSIAFTGGCTDTNEFNYLVVKTMRSYGGGAPGKPGAGLTRPHGLKFGTNFRTRGDDQWLDRHQEHRHDVDHGRQSSREPSLRIQVGGRGQAQPQRQDDRGRSALHPHRIAGRSVPARFAPAATSPSSAASSTTPSQNNRVAQEYLVNYTNAAFIIKDGFKLPEDGLFSGFDEATKTYDKATWNYQEGGNETGKVVPVAASAPATQNAPAGTSAAGRRSCRGSRAVRPVTRPKGRVIRRRARQAQRRWAAVPFLLRRCRRMSPTICHCNIRAASINC